MKIGFDANPMVGDMGGVGWHSYHLLRTMLAQKKGIDFVAYARPGANQPDTVGPGQGVERLGWMNSSKWGMAKRGLSDHLDLYHGTNFKMQTIGRYGGVVTIHDLWLDRHPEYSKKMLGQWPSSFKQDRPRYGLEKPLRCPSFPLEASGPLWFEREHIRVIPTECRMIFHHVATSRRWRSCGSGSV